MNKDIKAESVSYSSFFIESIKKKEILLPGQNMNESDMALFNYIKEHKDCEINDLLSYELSRSRKR